MLQLVCPFFVQKETRQEHCLSWSVPTVVAYPMRLLRQFCLFFTVGKRGLGCEFLFEPGRSLRSYTTTLCLRMSCSKCQNPLTLEVDYSDDEDVSMGAGSSSAAAAQNSHTVPDDVALHCGCHFHWYRHIPCIQLYILSNHFSQNTGNA